jgi:SAM-dependent methyltransferase
MDKPAYGASDHYLGEKGEEYFRWQSAGGAFAARVLAHRFHPYVKPADTVLDFGCGGGFLLCALDCARRLGVEINPVARKHALGLGVQCFADVRDVPDGAADVVVTNHALEHVENPIGAMRALRAKLKPGGTLVVCVPIDNWKHEKHYDPTDQNHHLYTWTPQLLGNCLVEAGYEVVGVKYRVHSWIPGWTVALYNRLPFWGFSLVCYFHGILTGKGKEVLAVARPPECEPAAAASEPLAHGPAASGR